MLLSNNERELTQEEWVKYWNGELKKSDLFSEAVIMGCGVYLGKPYEKNGKYYLPYSMGSSCD